MSTCTISIVLAHLMYSLLLDIIYYASFEISKGLIRCNFINMTMFPCGMLSTKFNIKQVYTIKQLFLLTEIIQIKKNNELLKPCHLVMSII